MTCDLHLPQNAVAFGDDGRIPLRAREKRHLASGRARDHRLADRVRLVEEEVRRPEHAGFDEVEAGRRLESGLLGQEGRGRLDKPVGLGAGDPQGRASFNMHSFKVGCESL